VLRFSWFLVNFRSGEFNIGLVGTVGGQCVRSVFFLILYFLYCHNNEPCTLHSLIVRFISSVSCSQSPATFTYTGKRESPMSRHYLYETPVVECWLQRRDTSDDVVSHYNIASAQRGRSAAIVCHYHTLSLAFPTRTPMHRVSVSRAWKPPPPPRQRPPPRPPRVSVGNGGTIDRCSGEFVSSDAARDRTFAPMISALDHNPPRWSLPVIWWGSR